MAYIEINHDDHYIAMDMEFMELVVWSNSSAFVVP